MNMAKYNSELEYKPDFQRAQKYWDAFWAHDIIDRSPVIIWYGNPEEGFINHPMKNDFSETISKLDLYFDKTLFMGECMPCYRPDFGPDQMAAFVGAPLISGPKGTNTSWSEKIVTDWKEALPLTIDGSNVAWLRMEEYHKVIADHAKGKFLISNLDMHSNIDLLEGLRGAENLLFDMLDQPDIVLKALADARRLYTKVFNKFWSYGKKDKLGSTSWINLYSRKKYNPIQADFIALLSPDMMRKFVLPAIEEEAQFLDHSCFHLDGPDALKHLDDILAIKEIDCIQWVPGAGNKPQIEWPDVLHKIHKSGKATIIYAKPEQIKAIHKDYPSSLVVYETTVGTEEQGLELLNWLVKNK